MQDLSQDRAWLDAFRAGEKDALERVFRTYARYVCAIVRRFGIVDETTQDDLLHDVFVRVLGAEMRSRYDGIRPYAGFLAGVVRNVVADHLRKSGKREAEPLDESLHSWSPGQKLPEEDLLAKEEQAIVGEFLSQLDTGETSFVKLRFEEGRSQRDVASDLGLTHQQVRTKETKIRSRFLGFLKKRGFE